MEITVKIDLSRFSDDELKSFVTDGIISRYEYISEINSRKDAAFERIKSSRLGRLFYDENGKPYPSGQDN